MDMQQWRLQRYLHEVALQCRYALAAFDAFQREIQVLSGTREQVREAIKPTGSAQLNLAERAFYHLQSLLVAAANVSKLLWPAARTAEARARADKRAVELRQTLNVPTQKEDSPIGSRDLRDAFEHFDERLDTVLEQERVNLADMNIMPRGAFSGNLETLRFLRMYDPETHVLSILDYSLPLPPLMEELQRLATLAGALEQAAYIRRQ